MRYFPVAVVAAVFVASAAPAFSQSASCSATISDVVFGEVSLNDATAQTIGDVYISCQGGASQGSMRACLSIGAGSGGAFGGSRLMLRSDNESLAYQLSAQGDGGAVWESEEFEIPLDAAGSGDVSTSILGEILSSGFEIGSGSYISEFTGADLSLTYGEASCEGGGSSSPDDFAVTATVTPSCTVTVGAMAFGDVSTSLETGASASATIDVTCTDGAPYSIELGAGQGAGVTNPEERRMSSGTDELVYGIYQDPTDGRPWGWTSPENSLEANGAGSAQSFVAHGIIGPGQSVNAGQYSDSVIVTIRY